MPSWLGPEAREEWARVVPLMEADGRLVPGIGPTLAAYCGAAGRLEIAERALADGSGLVAPVGPNGYRQQRPEVSIAQKAAAEVLKLGTALGLNPAGDVRLPKRPEDKPEDVTARLRREKLERRARRGDELAMRQLEAMGPPGGAIEAGRRKLAAIRAAGKRRQAQACKEG